MPRTLVRGLRVLPTSKRCFLGEGALCSLANEKLPGVSAQSALLWLELPIRITGKWWCDKRIEVLA